MSGVCFPPARAARSSRLTMEAGPIRTVNGHRVRDVPGGIFPVGGPRSGQTPRMVEVGAVGVGITPVTNGQYYEVQGFPAGHDVKLNNHPVVNVSWLDAVDYCQRKNIGVDPENRVGLLSEVAGARAARGPEVDLRHLEVGNGRLTNFEQTYEFLRNNPDLLENLAQRMEIGADILNLSDDGFKDRLKQWYDSPNQLYAWRVFATADGTLNGVWYRQNSTAEVSETGRLNAFGLSDMAANVSEWRGDAGETNAYEQFDPTKPFIEPDGIDDERGRVVRGGAFNDDADDLPASLRYNIRRSRRHYSLGFRVGVAAAPQHSRWWS